MLKDYKVVCGAPNVIPGMKVPFAKVGAEIQARNEEVPLKLRRLKLGAKNLQECFVLQRNWVWKISPMDC